VPAVTSAPAAHPALYSAPPLGNGGTVQACCAQITLFLDHAPFFLMHVPETPPTHAKLPQESLLSATSYLRPSGQVHSPPHPPVFGAFSITMLLVTFVAVMWSACETNSPPFLRLHNPSIKVHVVQSALPEQSASQAAADMVGYIGTMLLLSSPKRPAVCQSLMAELACVAFNAKPQIVRTSVPLCWILISEPIPEHSIAVVAPPRILTSHAHILLPK
jgi:hypothetical protein